MTITPEQLIHLTMHNSRMLQEDKTVLKEKLAKLASQIPAGQYVLFYYDYNMEDDDNGYLQQLANQAWAYPADLWDEVVDARNEWWEAREQFRGLTKEFWHLRFVREVRLLRYFEWLMPSGWVVSRGQVPGDAEERDGFYIQVTPTYEVTFNFKNGMRLSVPVPVDYDEEDTEDFDILVIEDAADLVAGFMTEVSPTNLHDLAETIDVDRK